MKFPFARHKRSDEYKSGLEESLAQQLTAAGLDAEYEPIRIPFTRAVQHYSPDFVLPNGIVIESKGYFVSADRSKHLSVKAQYPDLDIRFVFSTPNRKIGKKSKTTYSDWARMKGFQWATLSIPLSWLREPNNAKSIAAIDKLRKVE